MTEQELTQSFKKENEKFLKYKWDDVELLSENVTHKNEEFHLHFLKHFHLLYTDFILTKIGDTIPRIQFSIDRELYVQKDNTKDLEIIQSRLQKVNDEYLAIPVSLYNKPDSIIRNLFDTSKYRKISKHLCLIFYRNSNVSMLDWSTETIEYCLKADIEQIEKIISYSIENILLKDKIKNLETENTRESNTDNRLTTNQIIVLLDRLKFIQGIEHFTTTNQAKLISKICGFNEKNINKALVRLGKKRSELSKQNLNDINIVNQILVELNLDSKN